MDTTQNIELGKPAQQRDNNPYIKNYNQENPPKTYQAKNSNSIDVFSSKAPHELKY